ncbi:hypothetical protein ISTM_51 [Insectomime virus]|nr:hypothetical protein ISTM_51 [Insectomime virus]
MLDKIDPNALVCVLENVSLRALLWIHKSCPNRRDVCDYVFKKQYAELSKLHGVPIPCDWTNIEYISALREAMGPKKFSDVFLGPLKEVRLTRRNRLAREAEEIAKRIFVGPLRRKRMEDLRVLSCENLYGHGVKDGDVLILHWKICKCCSENHNETRQEIFRLLRRYSNK